MTHLTPSLSPGPEPAGVPEKDKGVVRVGDRVFSALAVGSAIFVVVLVLSVAGFLLKQAVPSLLDDKSNFLLSRDWDVLPGNLHFGILGMLYTTVLASVFAMVLAVPVAIGIALFLTFYLPRRISGPFAAMIDLLAAVPSVVYGLWGIYALSPRLKPVSEKITDVFGRFPLFEGTEVSSGTVFVGGVVLAIMILPIITAISREVFVQVPSFQVEAALALGATRWEMIRTAVLPFGRPGVISASMLGLGRALGETIAITLILSTTATGAAFSWSLFNGGETFASKIANNAAEFDSPEKTGAYIAAGLVLFALTFAVNVLARIIINRRKEFV